MVNFAGLMMLESGLSRDISESVRMGFAQNPQFYVRKDSLNRAVFFNEDKRCFCNTSPVVRTEKYPNGYAKIVTESGHTYNLTVIPENKKVIKEDAIPAQLEVVSKKKSSRSINYGDGYDKTIFVFNRPCSKEDFISFLNDHNYKLHEADGWWDNHSKIEGNGDTWTYSWVFVYTD